jgi:hypothetical protein
MHFGQLSILVARSGRESKPGASAAVFAVVPPQAVPKLTVGYSPVVGVTKDRITMSIFGSTHCSSVVLSVAGRLTKVDGRVP